MIELNKYLNAKDFSKLVSSNEPVSIHKNLMKELVNSHEFLKDFSINKVIYGVNTGFGPMAQYRVSDDTRGQLQLNLIRSHAAGAGNVMPVSFIRAAMIARLNSICQAKSGV